MPKSFYRWRDFAKGEKFQPPRGGRRGNAVQITLSSENRRAADKARPVLLVALGGESSDPVALCRHATEDCGAASTGGIAKGGGNLQRQADWGWGSVFGNGPRMGRIRVSARPKRWN
jgi:hypothetical protein